MADLMTGVSTYKLLEAQYGGFAVPALKIKINGFDVIKTMDLAVMSLSVTMSLKSAGCAIFKLAGLYDEKNHAFKSDAAAKFKLGTIVTIELGYLSSTEVVFKGYVDMLGAEFGETTALVVTLMDVRRLMMIGGRKHILHDVKNYSDAVKTVLGGYAKLCSPSVDATSDQLTKPVSQTTNDYDFIMRELIDEGKADREFFVVADKAYFRKPPMAATAAVTLRYGRELKSLKVDFSYLDLKIDVTGYSTADLKPVSASKSVSSFLEMSKVVSPTPVFTVAAPDADSRDKADVRAGQLARYWEHKNCTGQGTSVGLPMIVPGRYVKVEALESMLDNKYYITEVTHEVNEDGFLTHFEIGGVC